MTTVPELRPVGGHVCYVLDGRAVRHYRRHSADKEREKVVVRWLELHGDKWKPHQRTLTFQELRERYSRFPPNVSGQQRLTENQQTERNPENE